MRTNPSSGSKKLVLILILLLGGISASALAFPYTFLPASIAGEGSIFASLTNQGSVADRSITVEATVTTDKGDYRPGEIVQISGSGFWPNETITLQVVHIESSSQLKVSSMDSLTEYDHAGHEPWQVTAEADGTFASSWLVEENSLNKTLLLTADGQSSGLHAETTFTDSSIGTYDQCSNDDGDGYATGDSGCRWINGNLNKNNSTYAEGEATVQRLWLIEFTPGASDQTITLQYGTTKAAKHAYDYLTTWDHSEDWITAADLCQDITGCETALGAASRFDIPPDDNVPDSFEPNVPGDREFVMAGGTIKNVSEPQLVSGQYGSGDSETAITVTFDVASSGSMCTTKGQTTTCAVALWFGAHIADQNDWIPVDGHGGAASISGSPYHVSLDKLNGASIGERDNQMQSDTVIPPPDLVISKTAANSPINAGDVASFTVTVTNNGTGTANNVTLSDQLPAGVTWTDDSAACSISAGGLLTCNFGNLAAGASVSVTVSGTTDAADCGTLNNLAIAQADNNDPVQDDASIVVNCPDITVTKVADQGTVTAGTAIGFTITVTNNGPGSAAGVTLNDTLPTNGGLSWSIDGGTGAASCSINSGVLSCNFGTLANGASMTVHITSPTTSATCGTVNNTVTVAATNEPAANTGNNSASASVTVNCPDIAIDKTAIQSPVSAGTAIAFDITVTNLGPGTASGVTISDTLPSNSGLNWSIDAGDTTAPGCSITAGVLTCNIGTLAQGASVKVRITSPTTAATCGTVNNTGTVSATNEDPTKLSNNSDGASIVVQCPDLELLKVADAASVSAGSQIGFTITVENDDAAGTGTATGVTLNDPLPAGTGVDWSIQSQTGGANCVITGSVGSEVLSCGPIDLAPGASFSVHVVSGTTEASCKAYPNTATADATNHAAVQAQASTTVQCPDLQILKTASSGTIDAGTTATFTITVTNGGPGTATNVTLTDPLPAGVAWAITGGTGAALCVDPIVGNILSCNFGDMASGASFSVIVSGLTDAADCGTLSNTAVADADNDAPVQSSANITVQCGRIRVDKVTVPAGDPQSFAFSGSFAFNLTHSSALFDSGLIAPGQYSVIEGELAGWDLTGLDCDDTNSVEDIEDRTATVNLEGNETVTCTFTNSKLPTLIVRKVIQGSSETFSFVIDGNPTNPPSTNVDLTPPADDEAQTPAQIIELGDYRVTETPIPDGWLLTDASCVSDQPTDFVTDNSGIPIGDPWVTFTARYGDDVVCSFFDSEQGGATRTQGFWSTHTVLTNAIWNGTPLPPGTSSITPVAVIGSPDAYLCKPPDAGDLPPYETGTAITAIPDAGQNQVMGGFWASIANRTTNPKKRNTLDHARMQFLQQYLAAVLNVHAFGTPIGTTTLANARAAYCSNNVNNIMAQKNLLAAYNEGGDSVEFTPGVNATAKLSREQANIPFWDITFR